MALWSHHLGHTTIALLAQRLSAATTATELSPETPLQCFRDEDENCKQVIPWFDFVVDEAHRRRSRGAKTEGCPVGLRCAEVVERPCRNVHQRFNLCASMCLLVISHHGRCSRGYAGSRRASGTLQG